MEEQTAKLKTQEELKEAIVEKLKLIFDPEIPVNIYDLGLIYNIKLDIIKQYTYCTITMTLTSPGCPVADTILSDVHYYALAVPEIDEVSVNLVFNPIWDFSLISDEGKEILELSGSVLPQY